MTRSVFRVIAVCAIVAAALGGVAHAGDGWVQQKLIAGDGLEGDAFGIDVLVEGDTAVISAPATFERPGKVYVLERIDGFWQQVQVLSPTFDVEPPPDWADLFGWSLSLSGDTLLIGAPFAFNPQFGPAGAAYMFTRSDGVWEQEQTILPSVAQPSVNFGTTVAVVDDTAVVGAFGDNGNIGAAHVFVRADGQWDETQKLTPSDHKPGQTPQFGRGLAFDGETLMVGAVDFDFSTNERVQGAVYVYTQSAGDWMEMQKLLASDGVSGDQFGYSVALSGNTALVGARHADIDDTANQGAAYVFEYNGGVWSETQKLVVGDGEIHDRFGHIVALHGDTAVVGGNNSNSEFGGVQPPLKPGVAYMYTRESGQWNLTREFTAFDGRDDDWFGWAVSIDDSTLLIAASDGVDGSPSQGATYVFTQPAADHGVIEGGIASLGHCGVQPAMLSDATVEVAGNGIAGALNTGDNGHYQFAVPANESPLDITVTAPGHLPVTIEGISLAAGETITQDFDLALDAPCAAEDPAGVSVVLEPDHTAVETLVIGNLDGVAALEWAVTAAEPLSAAGLPASAGGQSNSPMAAYGRWSELVTQALVGNDFARPDSGLKLSSVTGARTIGHGPSQAGASRQPAVVDCNGEPGLMINDNGTVDDGYSWGADQVIFVDRFTPVAYPAPFSAVCVALITSSPTSMEFEIVVFDDTGPDGGPGSELGALAVSAEDLPGGPPIPTTPVWFGYDISSLDITVESGSVYIGVRWAPAGEFIAADKSPGNPMGFAGGYVWNDFDGLWRPLAQAFFSYRSLFVRAVANPAGCIAPGDIPWVSLAPTSGTTPAGESGEIEVTFDAAGLAHGEYEANLCIESNDPVRPLIVVPVKLTVVPADVVFFDRFEP